MAFLVFLVLYGYLFTLLKFDVWLICKSHLFVSHTVLSCTTVFDINFVKCPLPPQLCDGSTIILTFLVVVVVVAYHCIVLQLVLLLLVVLYLEWLRLPSHGIRHVLLHWLQLDGVVCCMTYYVLSGTLLLTDSCLASRCQCLATSLTAGMYSSSASGAAVRPPAALASIAFLYSH